MFYSVQTFFQPHELKANFRMEILNKNNELYIPETQKIGLCVDMATIDQR